MLGFWVVRVGFIHHLLFDRYGPWWSSLCRAAGADVVVAPPEAALAHAVEPAVAQAPALAFKLAIASALALQDVDLLVVPQLNPERDGGRGAAQDPWIADLPATLAGSAMGLPPIVAVPADLDDRVEGVAMTLLHRLTSDPGAIRRTWLRHRASIRPVRRSSGLPSASPQKVIAFAAQPWWATRPVLEALGETSAWIAPFMIDPADLRAEGWRLEPELIDTDAEALGAVRRFARSASVSSLRLLIDGASGADAWLARRARVIAGERLEVVDLRTLPQARHVVDALLAVPADLAR